MRILTMTTGAARLLGQGRLQDGLLALLAVAVISLMVLPLPASLLDALISINIGLSVLLMMLAMYVRTPLALSTFPTLLLFTTLLRLSLNIASTRAILLDAHAGQIIETFGKLVVGGNVVVGLVVFLIIAIVQFIVIAKGAERVAEVGARFTLDALPGKQMSIEAELRAGLIDKEESRAKRLLLQRESQLYGAMDGAMKFVKGDAIAGLLIALVNILAGVSIGVAMNSMPFAEAIGTYTILTVGDGLVSQIPSLFVSLAAGVLITRVAAKDDSPGVSLASEIGTQITTQPKALLVTAFVLLLFIGVPGFPKWQFLFWGLLLGAGGYGLSRTLTQNAQRDPMSEERLQRQGQARARTSGDLQRSLVTSYPLSLAVSRSFQPAIDSGELAARIDKARHTVTHRLGVPFPGVHLSVDATLPANAFCVRINEVPVFEVPVREAAASAERESIPPGLADPESTEHLGDVMVQTMSKHAADFLGLQETKDLLNEAQRSFPDLVAEAQRVVPVPRLMQVLKRLVEEDVSIRNLRDILQALIEWSPKEKDPVALTEHARNALALQLTWQFGGSARTIYALTFSPEVEETFRAAIKTSPAGGYLAMDPQQQQRLCDEVAQLRRAASAPGAKAAQQHLCLLASMDIRRYVKRMIETSAPALGVMSYQDLSADAKIVGVGVVTGQQEAGLYRIA